MIRFTGLLFINAILFVTALQYDNTGALVFSSLGMLATLLGIFSSKD